MTVIYQIFPERFAIGAPYDVATKLAQPAYHREGFIRHASWDEEPLGEKDFFGGDLQGVIDRLGYIQALGADAIYLTPVFLANSNHKYNTSDFHVVDPMFGDDAILSALIQALRSRGMRLIMDAVFNHVGQDSDWFQRALDRQQPYTDFFSFLPNGGYRCWWGFETLPELRLEHPLLARLLWRDRDSVLQRWLARGLHDWRFDAALDLGLDVAAEIRRAIAEMFPDARLTGEVMSFGAPFCADDLHFHGVMNYWLRSAVLGWFDGSVSRRAFSKAVRDYYLRYGHEGALRSWNVLSTHDTPRLRSILPDAADRELALTLQFTLPGEPVVYYGEENGMEGGRDPDNRRPMQWDEAGWDQRSRSHHGRLVALRRSRRELREGRLIVLDEYLDEDAEAIAYIRHTDVPNEEALVIVNRGDRVLEQRLLLPYTHYYPTLRLMNLLAPDDQVDEIRCEQGSVRLRVPPKSAALYVPDDNQPSYAFFKPRLLGANWP